jgi:radical SAM-linked protein
MITIRFVYSVSGVVKFLSHLDLLKLFNRALLRANLPVAYSEGFNPHPKISFGPPRGVGIEGRREYCDLQLKETLAADEVCERLNKALPKGVRVLEGRVIETPIPALMAAINLTVFEAEFAADEEILRKLAVNVAAFQASEKVEIVRHHPRKGDKTIDLAAGVQKLELAGNLLTLEIPFSEGGSVKPLEVLEYLAPEGATYRLARVGLFIQQENGERVLP